MGCKLVIEADINGEYKGTACKEYGIECRRTDSEKKDCPKWNRSD